MLFSVCLLSTVYVIQCMFIVESLCYLVYVYCRQFMLFSVCLLSTVYVIQCMFIVDSLCYLVYVYG